MQKFSKITRQFSNLIQKSPIKITENASIKIKEICAKANVDHLYFYASGGGCGGFKYNLVTNETISPKDIKVIENKATVYKLVLKRIKGLIPLKRVHMNYWQNVIKNV